jgi:type II secretory pathway pseudopilin PulG
MKQVNDTQTKQISAGEDAGRFPLVRHPVQVISSESGMTLLEIIFSVILLLLMTMAASSVIRNGIDVRFEMSQKAKVNHRLMLAMQRLSDDIQHAFILDSQRPDLNYVERATKSIFTFRQSGGSSELRLTTQSHKPITANSRESDQTFVSYKVEKDNSTGRPNLYRGDTRVIPTNLEEELPEQILARNVKSLKIWAWNGEDWREEWNSNKSDWRNMLPRMVRVEIEAYANEPEDESVAFDENGPTQTLKTVIFVQRSIQNREPRDAPKSANYY